jgi:hypothetical protein
MSRHQLFAIFFWCIFPFTVFSQSCPPNIGFDSTDYSNWSGATWSGAIPSFGNWSNFTPPWVNGIQTSGINSPVQAFCMPCGTPQTQHHTILTIAPGINNPPYNCPGWDSIAINWSTFQSDIPFLCPANNNPSVRLGSAYGDGSTEKLEYSYAVTSASTDISISFAIVFYRDVYGFKFPYEDPFFKFRLSDAANATIDSVFVEANSFGADPTLLPAPRFLNPAFDTSSMYTKYYVYRQWQTINYDLTPYIGQTVKIEFRTGDCLLGGHYAYAYVDASCTNGNPENVNDESSFHASPVFYADAEGGELFYRGLPAGKVSFLLYDVKGKIVRDQQLQNSSGTIDVSSLAEGIYFAAVYGNDFSFKQKIILMR